MLHQYALDATLCTRRQSIWESDNWWNHWLCSSHDWAKIAASYSIFLRTSASSCQSVYRHDYILRALQWEIYAYIKDSPTRSFPPFTQSSWLPSRYSETSGRQIGKRAAERSAYHVRGCLWLLLAISIPAVITIISVLTRRKYLLLEEWCQQSLESTP